MTSAANSNRHADGQTFTPVDTALGAEAVQRQLDRILAEPPFASSARLAEFLSYVVAETLAGRGSRIKQYTIAVELFARDETFDPQADPIVRIHAGRVRRGLETYYSGPGKDDELLISIPLGRYQAAFETLDPVHDDSGIEKQSNPQRAPAVVILPFLDQSIDKVDEYVLTGMVEELSAEVALFPDFRVITCGRGQIEPEDASPGQLAENLGVDFALVGTVRVGGDSMRLTLHLYRAGSNHKVWSHRVEREFTGANEMFADFKLVRSLASHVADTFGAVRRIHHNDLRELGRKEQPAFQAVLAFHHYQLTMAPDAYEQAKTLLEQVYQVSPDNPAINAKLGMVYLDAHVFGFPADDDLLEKGLKLARRARALDPMDQQAHFTMAFARMIEGDVTGMVASADKILEISPNSAFMTGAAAFFVALGGDYERAKELFDESVSLNPFYPSWFHFVPFLWAFNRQDYSRALSEARDFLIPGFYWSHIVEAAALAKTGDVERSQVAYRELLAVCPDFPDRSEKLVRAMVLEPNVAGDILSGVYAAAG